MSNRDLFSELTTALKEAKAHSEDKLTLKSHSIDVVNELEITPEEILCIREQFNMSR